MGEASISRNANRRKDRGGKCRRGFGYHIRQAIAGLGNTPARDIRGTGLKFLRESARSRREPPSIRGRVLCLGCTLLGVRRESGPIAQGYQIRRAPSTVFRFLWFPLSSGARQVKISFSFLFLLFLFLCAENAPTSLITNQANQTRGNQISLFH